jgi:hypothetical protein
VATQLTSTDKRQACTWDSRVILAPIYADLSSFRAMNSERWHAKRSLSSMHACHVHVHGSCWRQAYVDKRLHLEVIFVTFLKVCDGEHDARGPAGGVEPGVTQPIVMRLSRPRNLLRECFQPGTNHCFYSDCHYRCASVSSARPFAAAETMELIGAGMGRTGTVSLKASVALRCLLAAIIGRPQFK